MRLEILLASVCFASVLAAGCTQEEPPREPPSALPAPAPKAKRKVLNESAKVVPDEDRSVGDIHIDPKLAELCDVPVAYFPFDSSDLGADARAALAALGKCFTTGPGQGKGMRIVGHADPRGETLYNLALGQRRAGAVEGLLIERGVSDDSLESSSRGELDARGNDEESWAQDRKVEIFLVE